MAGIINPINPNNPNNPNHPSCFIAGTQIWTANGEKPIESLREGDNVLTRANSTGGQWGVKSDEVVYQPIEKGKHVIHGFNGEPAFASRNHVFHTTTGLRAINPEPARIENPWLRVGELKVGHVLLRTRDGENYESVTIENITEEHTNDEHIWGMHLREGLRSYHANGYLVHLNYPEITVKSIVDSIKKLAPHEQKTMLGHIRGLRPIFERFGGPAVATLLERELNDHEFIRKARA